MIALSNRKKTFVLESEQWIGRSIDSVFEFFSHPNNLEALTPPWLHFRVLKASTETIREGTTIDYQLRLHGIPLRWRSIIESWNPPFEFVDRQIRGPYRSWVHRHSFEPSSAGVLMKDHVEYSILGGSLVNRFFVRPDVQRIFAYRSEHIEAALNGSDVSNAGNFF
ncbi:MAG: ligand-binding SRPBCC domain-containing protein [Planctomycetota bacterium]|jgi:ligand-binding SRPBCC domain-containing protein